MRMILAFSLVAIAGARPSPWAAATPEQKRVRAIEAEDPGQDPRTASNNPRVSKRDEDAPNQEPVQVAPGAGQLQQPPQFQGVVDNGQYQQLPDGTWQMAPGAGQFQQAPLPQAVFQQHPDGTWQMAPGQQPTPPVQPVGQCQQPVGQYQEQPVLPGQYQQYQEQPLPPGQPGKTLSQEEKVYYHSPGQFQQYQQFAPPTQPAGYQQPMPLPQPVEYAYYQQPAPQPVEYGQYQQPAPVEYAYYQQPAQPTYFAAPGQPVYAQPAMASQPVYAQPAMAGAVR